MHSFSVDESGMTWDINMINLCFPLFHFTVSNDGMTLTSTMHSNSFEGVKV